MMEWICSFNTCYLLPLCILPRLNGYLYQKSQTHKSTNMIGIKKKKSAERKIKIPAIGPNIKKSEEP